MTPKQVLQWIIADLEMSEWHAGALLNESGLDRLAHRHYEGQRLAYRNAIENIRSRGAQILHADDLTQHDEKEAHHV